MSELQLELRNRLLMELHQIITQSTAVCFGNQDDLKYSIPNSKRPTKIIDLLLQVVVRVLG